MGPQTLPRAVYFIVASSTRSRFATSTHAPVCASAEYHNTDCLTKMKSSVRATHRSMWCQGANRAYATLLCITSYPPSPCISTLHHLRSLRSLLLIEVYIRARYLRTAHQASQCGPKRDNSTSAATHAGRMSRHEVRSKTNPFCCDLALRVFLYSSLECLRRNTRRRSGSLRRSGSRDPSRGICVKYKGFGRRTKKTSAPIGV